MTFGATRRRGDEDSRKAPPCGHGSSRPLATEAHRDKTRPRPAVEQWTKDPNAPRPGDRKMISLAEIRPTKLMLAAALAAALVTLGATVFQCQREPVPAGTAEPPQAAPFQAAPPKTAAPAETRAPVETQTPADAAAGPTQAGAQPAPAEPGPNADTRELAIPTPGWETVMFRNRPGDRVFWATLPPGWKVMTMENRSALYGRITGDDMTIKFDYGYQALRPEPRPGQVLSAENVNGSGAELLITDPWKEPPDGTQKRTWRDPPPGNPASMFLPDPTGDPQGEETMVLKGWYNSPRQQETALRIYRSIRVHPRSEAPIREKSPRQDALDAALRKAASRLRADPAQVELKDWNATIWGDGSLGCAKRGTSTARARWRVTG